MILQNNPHLKIERLLGGVKPRCTKLDRNFFLWLFNVFFVDFRLAEYIYIFFYPFHPLFLTHLTKLLKAGRREAEHPQCCRLPWTRKLGFGQKIFWKESKSNRPHVWAIRSKRKRKSRPGASSKRPRGGGGRIMLWDQDVVACSAEGGTWNVLSPSSVIKIWSVHYACLCLSPPRLSPSPRLQLQFGLFQSASIAFVCKRSWGC